MRSYHIVLATTLLAAAGIAGCSGDDPAGPGTGALRVTTAPGGDPDGYTVRVDDGEEQPVGPGSSIDFDGLTAGDHQVWLAGVAEHCAVTGDNPRTLTVTAGATALTIFQVTCASLLGSLEITTVMSGESLDPDGFGFSVDGRVLSTPSGATRATVPGLAPGEHTILLSGIASTCTPLEGPTRTVTIPSRGSVAVEFILTCSHRPWLQVSAGLSGHTCAVTTDHKAYCWGLGYLGDNQELSASPVPVAVVGGLQFRQISVGYRHACGVTTDDQAYCWGWNIFGQLGDGTTIDRTVPTPVAGNGRYRHMSAAYFGSCGLGTDNRAYCWGANHYGAVGDGTTTSRLSPVAVAGGLSFKQIEVGEGHSCGITTSSRAYCWGNNREGELGSGSTADQSLIPSAVAGDHSWISISAGFNHTCGVNASHRALCWGEGAIGDGRDLRRWTPRPVVGGHSFDRITAGTFSTCAETTTNQLYCWGFNSYGALGDGTTTHRLSPVAVSGGHFFSQASVGGFFACGVTPERKAYCWGRNFGGELGDGTREDRWTPVQVADPI